MSVLSAQSIRELCLPRTEQERSGCRIYWKNWEREVARNRAWAIGHSAHPMIEPFSERQVISGKSAGLSACTYDCRIAQGLILEPMPFEAFREWMISRSVSKGGENLRLGHWPWCALASTIEQFNIPANVCGSVLDKSSFARVFVSAFNTLLDPGWRRTWDDDAKVWRPNHLTVELVNLGPEVVTYRRGDPLCQVRFDWLDEPTELVYNGKYLAQPDRPVAAIREE